MSRYLSCFLNLCVFRKQDRRPQIIGFAYSRIDSIYYAGLIQDLPNGEVLNGTNGNYVTKDAIIAEANRNLDASAILGGLTANTDYNNTLSGLIPSFNRVGRGGILTPALWQRNINTL